MNDYLWGTPNDLRELLGELVSWESITLTQGEQDFPLKLKTKLQHLKYFNEHPQFLKLHEVDKGRKFLTALYKHADTKETIVLISHFDTVNVEEYGELKQYAFQPEELTNILHNRINELPEEAKNDLLSREYLFGRGTMDMKAGLAIHMSILEKAIKERWPINLLLLTVPDEEVNSAGMRAAVPTLLNLSEEYQLSYQLFLNGEPVFPQQPGDTKYYVYSGSIGKIMPSALFYGKETHVGEPLRGITAPFIASFLTQKMEWNMQLKETALGETTPYPVTLQQKDLRREYSVQTPYRAAALYNVFLMKRSAKEVMDVFEKIAIDSVDACNRKYEEICKQESVQPIGKVRVLKYSDLKKYVLKKYGQAYVNEIIAKAECNQEWDDREKSIRIADYFMMDAPELTPAVVLLFAPPYYPAVNSSDNELIKQMIDYIKKEGDEKFSLTVHQSHYFNGICDLSYVNFTENEDGWTAFKENTPVWGKTYELPFEEMTKLRAPVLNVGPFGKDAHKRTERVHIKSAFEEVPVLVENMIKMFILLNVKS